MVPKTRQSLSKFLGIPVLGADAFIYAASLEETVGSSHSRAAWGLFDSAYGKAPGPRTLKALGALSRAPFIERIDIVERRVM